MRNLLLVVLTPLLFSSLALAQIPAGLTGASVMIDSGRGSGSGVLFKNGQDTFVWTAAHVIPTPRVVTVLDAEGRMQTRYVFGDVGIIRAVVEDGRKVGENFHYARVLRWSRKHDLALLLVHKRGYGSSSVRFFDGVPEQGRKLWHVGSMHGYKGMNSVAEGIFAFSGRLRKGFQHDEQEGLVWDQVSGVAHPGSSGGGVFLQGDGRCVGLVTDFLTGGGHQTHGAYCITPSRRLIAYAREQKAAWAVDAAIKPPQREAMLLHCPLDEPLPADVPTPSQAARLVRSLLALWTR